MATRKLRRFGTGGSTEAEDKEAGLKASKDEKVGFFERMRMGNIDDEKSEAYRRFGAGRGKAERTPVEDRVATPVKREAPKVEKEDEMEAANKREPIPVPAGKKAEPDAPAKAAPKAEAKPAAKPMPKAEAKATPKAAPKADTSNYSNEGRGSKATTSAASPKGSSDSKKSLMDQIPLDAPRTPVKGEKADSTELGRNIGNAMNALPGIQAVGRIPGAAKAAQKAAGSRAVSTAVDDGVTFLGKSGRRQVGGFDELSGVSGRAGLANNPTRQLPAPPKQIGGPSKADLVARDRAARAAARKEAMDEENATRHGLDRSADDFAEKAAEVRKNLGGDDFTLGYKRGGKVKPKAKTTPVKKMASGGSARGWGMARGARKAKII